MSRPSPEVYERGRGMDAHNAAMREIRARNDETHDPREPTRVWLDEDNTPDGVVDSLTVILNTGGCRWARAGGCTMCGYVAESVDGGTVPHDDLMAQVDAALAHEREHSEDLAAQVKLYTSGSFLDEREIPPETRTTIAEAFAERDRIVIESLPDFVEAGKIRTFVDRGLTTDVAIGLETASDRIRHDCVNKYVEFADFEAACAKVRRAGDASGANRRRTSDRPRREPGADDAPAGVKAYLLLKPPFLAEGEAIRDMVGSVRRCAGVHGCHTVSMNPCNVQRHTLVEELYHADGYRPPWLWSVVAVLRETADADVLVVSDPVGHGSSRGPHNCGECDDVVQRAIKDFDHRQDPSVFDEVSCECEATWRYVREHETSYNQPIAK